MPEQRRKEKKCNEMSNTILINHSSLFFIKFGVRVEGVVVETKGSEHPCFNFEN